MGRHDPLAELAEPLVSDVKILSTAKVLSIRLSLTTKWPVTRFHFLRYPHKKFLQKPTIQMNYRTSSTRIDNPYNDRGFYTQVLE